MTNRFPTSSVLFSDSTEYQYSDSFVVSMQRDNIEPWELIAAFFQSAPGWVDGLFILRNQMVKHLGLQTGSENSRDLTPPYQVGRKIGIFRIITLTDSEVVLGEDDRHLDFRISLLLNSDGVGYQLEVSTLVKTKNTFGVAYFSVVKHIHRLIVPIMLKAMATKIDQRLLPQHRS